MNKEHHTLPYGLFINVWLLLLSLTALTVAAAQVHFGPLNTWIALLIAGTKTSLVILFFMHVKFDTPFIKGMVLFTIFVMVILFSLLFTDYPFRF